MRLTIAIVSIDIEDQILDLGAASGAERPKGRTLHIALIDRM